MEESAFFRVTCARVRTTEMIGTMHDRHGIRRSFLSMACLTVVLGIGGSAAQPEVPSSLDLEVPFLSGTESWASPLPIDLGGDGATDFIFFGSGLLLGAYPLEESQDERTFHVIGRDGTGGWHHLQSFTFDWDVTHAVAGDLDGDGLDDLVVLTYYRGDRKLHVLRQSPAGRLSRSTEMMTPEDVEIGEISIANDGGARVLLHVRWYDEVTRETVYGGVLLAWREESGFDLLWQEAFPIDAASWNQLQVVGLINTPTGPAAIAYDYSYETGTDLVAIPVQDDGWGDPYQPPISLSRRNDFAIHRYRGRNGLWCWTAESPDTLKILLAEKGSANLTVKRIPINGLPGIARTGSGPWYEWNTGESSYLCRRIYYSGTVTDKIVLITVDQQRECAAVASLWGGPHSILRGPVVDPSGRVEILWYWRYGWILLPPKEWAPQQPDYSLHIGEMPLQGDFDGDTILDLVVYGRPDQQPSALYLLMGLDHHPWFGEPILIGAIRPIEEAGLGDVDGDGQTDLVFRCEDRSTWQHYYVPYYWNGWRFIRDDDARIYEPMRPAFPRYLRSLHLHDYDGDGRDELISRYRYYFIGWETDRRPRQNSAYLELPSFNETTTAADLDGDGRDDYVSALRRSVNISWINPLDGTRQRVGGWITPQSISTMSTLNLDTDPASELLLRYSYGSTILDFGQGVEGPCKVVSGPNSFVQNGTWFSGDIDLDGRCDLIQTREGLIEICFGAREEWTVRHFLTPESISGIPPRDEAGTFWLDVDRDGDLDLMVVCSDGIRMHLNDQIDRPMVSQDIPWIRVVSGNPGRDRVRVAIRVEKPGMVSMGLFDVSGRRIWSSTQHAIAERWFDVVLDPESVGRSLAAGVYFLRVEGGECVATRQIILAR